MSLDNASSSANRLSTYKLDNTVLGSFTRKNKDTYLDMVQNHIINMQGSFTPDKYHHAIGFIRPIEADKDLETEISARLFEYTKDNYFYLSLLKTYSCFDPTRIPLFFV